MLYCSLDEAFDYEYQEPKQHIEKQEKKEPVTCKEFMEHCEKCDECMSILEQFFEEQKIKQENKKESSMFNLEISKISSLNLICLMLMIIITWIIFNKK